MLYGLGYPNGEHFVNMSLGLRLLRSGRTVLLFYIALFSGVQAFAQLTLEQQKELGKWGSHYQAASGTILNVPSGKVDPKIRAIESEVRSIIEALSPGLLKNRQIIL